MAIRNWVWDSLYKFYKILNLNMEKLSEFRAWKSSSFDSDYVDGKKIFFEWIFEKKFELLWNLEHVQCLVQ